MKANTKFCLGSQGMKYRMSGECKFVATLILAILASSRIASAAMVLPGGIENILGFTPKSTFKCERDGYFGDVDNDCRLFHLCQKHSHPDGRTEWQHWTYACGNQTMFNQLTLTCAFVDEAIPCRHASQFQYLNEVIHRPKEPFLTDADVTSGFSYYNSRILSDGARARAFTDSNLLAQIGGQVSSNGIDSGTENEQRPPVEDNEEPKSKAVVKSIEQIEPEVVNQQQLAINNQRQQQEQQKAQQSRRDQQLRRKQQQQVQQLQQRQRQQQQQEQQQQQQLEAQKQQQEQQRQLQLLQRQVELQQQLLLLQQQPQQLERQIFNDPRGNLIINQQQSFQTNNQPIQETSQFFAPIQDIGSNFLVDNRPTVEDQRSVQVDQVSNIRLGQQNVPQIENVFISTVQPKQFVDPTTTSVPSLFQFSVNTDHNQGSQGSFIAPVTTLSSLRQQLSPTTQIQPLPVQTNFPEPLNRRPELISSSLPVTTVPTTTTTLSASPVTTIRVSPRLPTFVPRPLTTSVAQTAPIVATTTIASTTPIAETSSLANIQPTTEIFTVPLTTVSHRINARPVPTTTVATSFEQPAPKLRRRIVKVSRAEHLRIQQEQQQQQQQQREQQSQQQQLPETNSQNEIPFDPFHMAFQSTRISAQQNAAKQEARRQESALVMRQQQRPATGAQEDSVIGPDSRTNEKQATSIDDSFWRRPFDMSFTDPRVKRLVTRRV